MSFVSYSANTMPNKDNCDNKFKKPRRFVIFPDKNSKKFAQEYLFISFYSKTGITATVKVDFPDPDVLPDKSPDGKRMNRTASGLGDPENDPSKGVLSRYKIKDLVPKTNIIHDNKHKMFIWPHIKRKNILTRRSLITQRTQE